MQQDETIISVIERSMGFEKYESITRMVRDKNVETNSDFQVRFNGFYGVRRDKTWRECFYKCFEACKKMPIITFDIIIDKLYHELRNNKGKNHLVEASFSSKVLATLDPNKPILDRRILKNTGLSLASPGASAEDRIKKAKNVYEAICQRYADFMGSAKCMAVIELFDTHFPNYKELNPVKKVDWFLWKLNRDELERIGLFGRLLG